MYDYRKMTPDQQCEVVEIRRKRGFPLHAPPHFQNIRGEYLISAACYEHRHIFIMPEELSLLAGELLDGLHKAQLRYVAWVCLPNHYHVLLETETLTGVSEAVRKIHSRVATQINGLQKQRGRQVWFRYSDRYIRTEAHHWASVNYVHYNPIKHGYVKRMQDWSWSSIHEYLEQYPRPILEDLWKTYPVKDYGKGWDW